VFKFSENMPMNLRVLIQLQKKVICFSFRHGFIVRYVMFGISVQFAFASVCNSCLVSDLFRHITNPYFPVLCRCSTVNKYM